MIVGLTASVSKARRAASRSALARSFTVDRDAVSIVDNADAHVGREHNAPACVSARKGARREESEGQRGRRSGERRNTGETRGDGARRGTRAGAEETARLDFGFLTDGDARGYDAPTRTHARPLHAMRLRGRSQPSAPRRANPTSAGHATLHSR